MRRHDSGRFADQRLQARFFWRQSVTFRSIQRPHSGAIMASNSQRIDLHHHVFPPELVADLGRRNIEWTGGAGIPKWSVPMAREMMERNGIAAAVGSVEPQVYWGDSEYAVRWARHSNEFLAGIVRDDRAHFGGFAALPLPDTGAACRELEQSLDTLGLDGAMLCASHGKQYLGDPEIAELYQELNRRSAVVVVHQNTVPPGSDVPKLALPNTLVEFVFDTTRAITSLIYSGTLERYPSIRFIFSHAGGTVPYIAWRLGLGEMSPVLRERAPKGAMHYLRRLYYDTALASSDHSLSSLMQLVPPSQVVFGSDFPFANEAIIKVELTGVETSKFLDDAARKAIDRDSALALFPRFGRDQVRNMPAANQV